MLSALGFQVGLVLDILLRLPGVIIAITLHEYTKSRVSARFGDPKPGNDGRLTLNPLKHIEPIGFICLCAWGMGWGKPVQTLPSYYGPDRRKRASLLTYITPVVVNLFAGLVFGVCGMLFAPLLQTGGSVVLEYVYLIIMGAAVVNISFALVQCVPVYPMAGERVLCQFLKANTIVKMTQYQSFWQILLMIGIASGYLAIVVNPVCRLLLGFAI